MLSWVLVSPSRSRTTEVRSMSSTVATCVHAGDPISQAGVVAQLRMRPEIRVVDTRGSGGGRRHDRRCRR